LRKPHATRTGHLYRRRGLLWAGMVLLFMGLASGGPIGWVFARDANFNPYKPLWMLVREVGSSDPTVNQPAMREIVSRMSAGQITDEKIHAYVEAALKMQADPKRPWQEGWGNFIESARTNGKVSDKDWQRYLKQAVVLSLEVRSVH